jgi:hypothetical protein
VTPRSRKIDILCLLKIQSKSIAPKPPAELTQSPVYPPKKLSGVATLSKYICVIRKQDQFQTFACSHHVIDIKDKEQWSKN